VGAVVVAGIGILGIEYARHSWPFAVHSARGDETHAGHGPANQPDPHAGHAGHAQPGKGAAPAGYAPVTVDPSRAAALGLTTDVVDERDFTRTIRTVGTVVVDETRTAHVHVKIRGWINDILVDFVGRQVGAGDPLCTIYSQDVYSAEVEFLSVLDRAASRPAPDPLLDAARRRLSLWDVPRREVERLEKTREASRTYPLLAPRAGTVVAKEALHGMYVDPSVELYTLSDLSRVWVLADIYDSDVPYVRLGAHAQLLVQGREAPVDATVSFLSPTIDEPSRTRKVRFSLDNPKGRLLPGAFVTVAMDIPLGKGVSVPENAVIRTGTRAIVFVAHDDQATHLEPREVVLGPLVGDRYRIDGGVKAGDRVATGAQFLLDSESRLRATSAPGGGHVH
jgi:Cu(I)/Ag(I) efflux system membrane fusion protein